MFCSSISVLALLSMVAMLASAQTSYNTKTQICCNGTVTDKDSSRSTRSLSCCGINPIDSKKSLCCPHDQVLDILDPDIGSHGCCYDQASKTSTYYNNDKQVCCDGMVLDKPDQGASYGCCNGQLFNMTKVCCGGMPLELGDDEACCGEQQVYDTKSEMCCEQYSYNESDNYRFLEFTISDADSDIASCCGLQMYNQTTETCCDGVVKPKIGEVGQVTRGKCCGFEPYDANTQRCCSKWREIAPQESGVIENKLYDIEEGASAACCGLTLFDYREEICCSDETVIAKPEDSDKDEWMSCCGGQVITNYTTQICHGDKIYQREDCNYYFCGDQLYDQRLQYCCADQVAYAKRTTMTCCHGAKEVFNRTTHTCCSDVVKEFTDEDRENKHNACCAVQYYAISDGFL